MAVELVSPQWTWAGNSINLGFKLEDGSLLSVEFVRTLRIPDDHNTYSLPPGLGAFPIKETEKYENIPQIMKQHGGFFIPMHQCEALWIKFNSNNGRPYAVKIAAGSINAIDGNSIELGLNCNETQDYCAVPTQPWIDGFCVEKGKIRQFVAMPLGNGTTVEEQLTGQAYFGGIQFIVYPMKQDRWDEYQNQRINHRSLFNDVMYSMGMDCCYATAACASSLESPTLGLGSGGMMEQEIYDDDHTIEDYDLDNPMIAFVHLCNTDQWKTITGEEPPPTPISASTYTKYGYPWFEYYTDSPGINGSATLAGVKTVNQVLGEYGTSIPDNQTITDEMIVVVCGDTP